MAKFPSIGIAALVFLCIQSVLIHEATAEAQPIEFGKHSHSPKKFAAVEAISPEDLNQIIDSFKLSVSQSELLKEASIWLTSLAAQGCTLPKPTSNELKAKLGNYFGGPRLLKSREQLDLLRYTTKWLCDSGYDSDEKFSTRGALMSASDALEQAETWVFGNHIQSPYDVDVLHQMALFYRDLPKEQKVRFSDFLLRQGKVSAWREQVLTGTNGARSFEAARDRIEFYRLAKRKESLNADEKKYFEELKAKVKEHGKSDAGIFLFFGDDFDAYKKTANGIRLQGFKGHAKDSDYLWKIDFFMASLKDANLDYLQKQKVIKIFLNEEGYPVEALRNVSNLVVTLTGRYPSGKISDEILFRLLEEFRRTPVRSVEEVERLRDAWKLSNQFAKEWVAGKVLERKFYSYSDPAEFNHLLGIIDLYVPDASRAEWDSELDKRGLYSWVRRHPPLDQDRFPDCKRDVEKYVRSLPAPHNWSIDEEVKRAIAFYCDAEMLKWENQAKHFILRAYARDNRLADVIELVRKVDGFEREVAERLSKVPPAEVSRCNESEVHSALCLASAKEVILEVERLLTKADNLANSLQDARLVLYDGKVGEELKKVADSLARVQTALKLAENKSNSTNDLRVVRTPDSGSGVKPVVAGISHVSEIPSSSLRYNWEPPGQATNGNAGKPNAPTVDEERVERMATHKAAKGFMDTFLKANVAHLQNHRPSKTDETWIGNNNALVQHAVHSSAPAVERIESLLKSYSEQLKTLHTLSSKIESDFPPQYSKKLEELDLLLGESSPKDAHGNRTLHAAHIAKSAAELAYARQDYETGDAYTDIATVLGRVASGVSDHKKLLIGVTPGIGWAQDVLESFGTDIDGNPVTGFDRGMAIFGVLTGGIGSKAKITSKAFGRLVELASDANRASDAKQAIETGTEAYKARKFEFLNKAEKRQYEIVKVEKADDLNAAKLVGDEPPYSPGTFATTFKSNKNERFVRVYDGEKSERLGTWVAKAEDVVGLSPAQIKSKLNLKAEPKFIADVDVPPGTLMRRSRVGQNKFGEGSGTHQYELLERIPNEKFANERLLQ